MMMRKDIFILVALLLSGNVYSQKTSCSKDYSVNFAIQAGISTGFMSSGTIDGMKYDGIYGLKMDFPFQKKWSIGAEINYTQLRTENKHDIQTLIISSSAKRTYELIFKDQALIKINLHALSVPFYVKYKFNAQRTAVFLGGYFSVNFKRKISIPTNIIGGTTSWEPEGETQNPSLTFLPDMPEADKWDAGLTLGIEQQIVKQLFIMLRVSGSCKDILKQADFYPKKLFPFQANLTLSYNLLKLGKR